MATKFTFKTNKPTGAYKSFHNDEHVIKLDKKEVGQITHSHPHRIRLIVEKDDVATSDNPNCTWKWITLKKESELVADAKQWLNEKFDSITTKFKLHKLEE